MSEKGTSALMTVELDGKGAQVSPGGRSTANKGKEGAWFVSLRGPDSNEQGEHCQSLFSLDLASLYLRLRLLFHHLPGQEGRPLIIWP